MLVASLFDRDAVRASPAREIDGRMTLLSLARLEPELGLLYRRWGLAARRDGSGFAAASLRDGRRLVG